jgi:hypothetical protein
MAFAQTGAARHNFEIDAGGVFPVGGYLADEYSPGPAGRAGYELRLFRPIGAEVGLTEAGLPGTSCSRFGCEHPRENLRLLDFGLRAHLTRGRIDLSAGVGGGHIWYGYGNPYNNSTLLQYSGKATVGLDRVNHFQLAFTVRTWRDVGRPIQQWLSTTAGIVFAFGRF